MQNLFIHSEKIKQEIEQILENFYVEDGHSPLAREFYWHMKTYTTSGKLFRGCLLMELYASLQKKSAPSKDAIAPEALVKIAAGLELICSGLLVHDDIMDHDTRRRGLLTTHRAMATWAEQFEFAHPQDFGASVAICFGDVLFFLGNTCFSQASVPPELALQIMRVSSHELMLLGLAQTEDLRLACMPIAEVTEDEIIKMQYGKTGRYTGRWPMALAATVAGLDARQTEQLGRVGDEIGLLYQWRDDYLGLYGDPKKTGKNVLSDIQEGKKTLYYWHAWHSLKGTQKQLVEQTFGNPDLSLEMVSVLLKTLESAGILAKVQKRMEAHLAKTRERISKAQLPAAAEAVLLQVVALIAAREK